MTDKKVLVIGLDGATWDLLKPLAEKKKLPNVQKLMENGVWGALKSTILPVTGPAWVSFATGRNPGKHGCYDFSLPDKDLDKTKTIDTTKIKRKTFYEILCAMDKKCILINLPVSHPPRIGEVVITSFLTKGEDFVFPSALVDEISELKSYRLTPNLALLDKSIQDYIDDLRDIENNRFKCAKKLYEKKWDFFFILFSATDWIQHRVYDKLLSNPPSNAMVLYQEIDEYIGWFMDNAPEEANVFLMSDHGFFHYEQAFSVNGWLRQEGYLKGKKKSQTYSFPQKIGKISEAAEKRKKIKIPVPIWLFDNSILYKPARFLFRIINKIIPISPALRFEIDLSKTYAYCLSSSNAGAYGSIYINNKSRFMGGVVDKENYENIRDEIIERLKELRDNDGHTILTKVFRKEDIYWGNELGNAPDIILFSDGYVISPGDFSSHSVIKECSSNEHALNGIFVAHGPDIKKNVKIENAEIIDLAPTILHLMNAPIPKDMDGRVLKEIFKEDSEFVKRETVYQEVDEKEKIREKIKALKSLGIDKT